MANFAVRRKSRLLRMSRRRLVTARLPQPVLQPFARLSGEVVRVRVGDDTLRTLSRELGQPACSLTLVGRPEDDVQHVIVDTEVFRRRHGDNEDVRKAEETAGWCSCCGDSTAGPRISAPRAVRGVRVDLSTVCPLHAAPQGRCRAVVRPLPPLLGPV